MAINFNDNLKILAGKPIDERYFASDGLPYTSTSAVTDKILLTYRYLGLTVNISNVEYWWKDGLNDVDLIEKKGESSDPAAGNVTVDPAITLAGTNYGSYEDGDTIAAGTSIQEVLENMMTKLIPPTYTSPSINLTPNAASAEVGTYIAYFLDTTFTQNDAGSLNEYLLERSYDFTSTTLYNGPAIIPVSDTETSPIKEGPNLMYTAECYYDDGPIKNDNLGNPYPTGQILAGSITDTFTVTGYRAYFYTGDTDTTAPITSADVRNIGNLTLNPNNGTTFTINIPSGATRVVFAYPDYLQAVSSVKYVELGNGEVKDTFTLSSVNTEGDNNYSGIDYKIYTYIPAVSFGDSATYIVTI